MNTYKVKTINAIKRLAAVAKRKSARKPSITPKAQSEPLINQLYEIDVPLNGTIYKNVKACYAGKSKSGQYMKFQLNDFFTAIGVRINLLCVTALPANLRLLKQGLFMQAA